MGEGFRKFKKRIVLNTVLRSVLFGISLGIAAFAVVLLVSKLTGRDIDAIWYIIAAGGGALLCGGVMFLILRQSDLKISRRLDRELGLREKVKTMLEFEEDNSDIAQIQREDANEHLLASSVKGFTFRRVWICAVTLLVAGGILAAGIIAPKKEAPLPYDEDYQMSGYEMQALLDLIQYVKDSEMGANLKSNVVYELEVLLNGLNAATKESQKKNLVIDAIKNTTATIDGGMAYDELGPHMKESGFERMERLDAALNEFIENETSDSFNSLRGELLSGDINSIKNNLTRFNQELQASIRYFSENKGDMGLLLCDTLVQLNGGVKSITLRIDDPAERLSVTQVQDELNIKFNEAQSRLHLAMQTETNNSVVGAYTVAELMRIFGISRADLEDKVEELPPETVTPEEWETDAPEDQEKPEQNDGGIGTGEQLFGGKDPIYSPEHGEQKPYPEVLDTYTAKIYAVLRDGNVSEEIKEYINAYLNMLSDGSKSED